MIYQHRMDQLACSDIPQSGLEYPGLYLASAMEATLASYDLIQLQTLARHKYIYNECKIQAQY
jgi:hypothetical protein